MRILKRAHRPLVGEITVPGDKSISHRAVLLALVADGPCCATGWLDCADTQSSLAAVRALGAKVRWDGDTVTVTPPGARPPAPLTIDCGNSGTTARLLLGLLAGWLSPGGAAVTLIGDDSLGRRPMARVVDPLRRMGADLQWLGREGCLPVAVRGAGLRGIVHELPVASAQVKSALLLAGLFADGRTVVRGAEDSRDHTELMLRQMHVNVDEHDGGPGLDGPCLPRACEFQVPGDPSSAAFFQVAAAIVPGSDVTVRGQSLNPTRTGALDVLRRAGAEVTIAIRSSGVDAALEVVGDVRVRAGALGAFLIGADAIPSLVDEIPALAVLATQCHGTSRITGAGELRVKESDRLALLADNLSRLAAAVVEEPAGLSIDGPCALIGGTQGRPLMLSSGGDHRLAMAMNVAALVTSGETALDDEGCVAVSFPGFFIAMAQLLSDDPEPRP